MKIDAIEGEVWKDVVGYEGHYIVSNKGRVYSYKVEREVKLGGDKDGYLRVHFSKPRMKSKTMKIHRVVLSTFAPIDGWEKLTVNHLDLDKQNNNLENLVWATIQENNKHARDNKEFKVKKGFGHHSSKICEDDLENIYKLSMYGLRNSEISKFLNIETCVVKDLLNGLSYSMEFGERLDKISKIRKVLDHQKKEKEKYEKKRRNGAFLTKLDEFNILIDYFVNCFNFDEVIHKYQLNKCVIDALVSNVPKDDVLRRKRLVDGDGYQSGEKNGRSKLNKQQVLDIFDEVKSGKTKSELSRKYNVSRNVILKISDGRLWSSVTGQVYEHKK